MRALVVDDSPAIRESVSQALREAGYAVDSVGDGRQAVIHARTSEYDAIVLDLGLPQKDGMDVLRELRARRVSVPVLVLTARDAVEDRVRGLQEGADDYVVKPFSLRELVARVGALVRRSKGNAASDLNVGPLLVDINARVVKVSGRELDLTPREYALLSYLAHRAGTPVSRLELEEHLYDEQSQVFSNAIESAVCTLRAKLEAAGCPGMIRTRRKVGYLLSPEVEE